MASSPTALQCADVPAPSLSPAVPTVAELEAWLELALPGSAPNGPTVTDLFCGAGGSSLAALLAGCDVRMAVNHWPLAVETHGYNIRSSEHDCADISQVDPRRYPSTDILCASPECTNHSVAKGGKRFATDPGKYDPQGTSEQERSRATMFDVPRFAALHNYKAVIVENVVDARKWGPAWDPQNGKLFASWLAMMTALDYDHELVYLNSQFAPPTPQSRDRLYIVFWKRGLPAPDLDFRPWAFCQYCERDVQARQQFKTHTKSFKQWGEWGRYGARNGQYVYCCPDCGGSVEPRTNAAAEAIDWALEGVRIADRRRGDELEDSTLARIAEGLRRFGAEPALIPVEYGTVAASKSPRPVTGVFATQTARLTTGLVVPPGFTVELRGANRPKAFTEPLTTVCASGNHHGVVTLPEQAAAVAVQDCAFRMLTPMEVQRAMAFPESYKLLGSNRNRVRLAGNAVTPPAMKLLLDRVLAALW